MERKNMVLLTVIAVATLLVAVVGATFAYFTASTSASGQTNASVTTNKLDGATITFTGTESKLEMLDYPGGLAVYGASATIDKQKPDDSNEYQATFNLKITYTNQTSTDLDWTLYMVAQEYDGLNAAKETTCELKQKPDEETGEAQLWYSDKSDDSGDNSQSCTGSGITDYLTKTLSAKTIASGKLIHGKSETEITKNTVGDEGEYVRGQDADLENRKINTSDLKTKYYYLVVKYPNKSSDQSGTDEEKEISVSLSIDGPAQTSLYVPSA